MTEERISIKKWAEDDRPRDKMLKKHSSTLSNAELLSIILGCGTQKKTSIELARDLLHLCNNDIVQLGKISARRIMTIKGISEAKAVNILAALELGRRRHAAFPTPKPIIKGSEDIATYLRSLFGDLAYEICAVVYLNRANRLIDIEIVSEGGITGNIADPRLILKKAIELHAVGLIICHNHPSGNLKPSKPDIVISQKIKKTAFNLDIIVLDHIIVSDTGYFSFADHNLL